MFKKILLIFCLFFILKAQGQEAVNQFNEALSKVVVLKNEKELLPVRRLDTCKIAVIQIGISNISTFENTLANYTQITPVQLPEDDGGHETFSRWLTTMKARFNMFIIAIGDDTAWPGETQKGLLTLLPNTITILFSGTQTLIQWPALNEASKSLLVSPQTEWAASIAAQIIMGGIGSKSVLSEGYDTPFYQKGAGIETKAMKRFRFSPPELVGMNRQLIEDSIKAIVEAGITAKAFPGAQVLVAKDGHIVYHKTFGYHTYDSLQLVKTTDLYDYASITKVTSTLPAIMKLIGENKFSLDKPLKDYLPEFKNSNKADLTYRNMLTHQARLRAWIPFWQGTVKGNAWNPWKKKWDIQTINNGRFKAKTLRADSTKNHNIKITDQLWLHKDYKYKKLFKSIRKSPLNEKPGYVYSDLSFHLLPEILGRIIQEDYETYIKREIYHKLGAYTITYNPLRLFSADRIIPTERDTFFRMMQIRGQVHDEGAAIMAGLSGNAGLFSSAIDLAKMMQLYLNWGYFGDEQILPASVVKDFSTCQFCAEGNRRGIGFDKPLIEYDKRLSSVAKDASPSSFGHSGYTGTFFWGDPENNLLFLFFSNRVYPTRNSTKIYDLNIRPRIHQVLYDALKR